MTCNAKEVNARAHELAEKAYIRRMKAKNLKVPFAKFDPVKASLNIYPDKTEDGKEIVYVMGWKIVLGYVRDGIQHYMPVNVSLQLSSSYLDH